MPNVLLETVYLDGLGPAFLRFRSVGSGLLQHCLRLWDEIKPLVFLSDGQCSGCQHHGFVYVGRVDTRL